MSWIQTYTGKVFEPQNPTPESIDIEDIAHALGMICRFNGHVQRFYSVAEHCVVMSNQVSEVAALPALLHDAAEAYVSDLALPIKPMVDGYDEMEMRIREVIEEKYRANMHWAACSHYTQEEVKKADRRMLTTEMQQLMSNCEREWESTKHFDPYPITLRCLSPTEAKRAFIFRFYQLTD